MIEISDINPTLKITFGNYIYLTEVSWTSKYGINDFIFNLAIGWFYSSYLSMKPFRDVIDFQESKEHSFCCKNDDNNKVSFKNQLGLRYFRIVECGSNSPIKIVRLVTFSSIEFVKNHFNLNYKRVAVPNRLIPAIPNYYKQNIEFSGESFYTGM